MTDVEVLRNWTKHIDHLGFRLDTLSLDMVWIEPVSRRLKHYGYGWISEESATRFLALEQFDMPLYTMLASVIGYKTAFGVCLDEASSRT